MKPNYELAEVHSFSVGEKLSLFLITKVHLGYIKTIIFESNLTELYFFIK